MTVTPAPVTPAVRDAQAIRCPHCLDDGHVCEDHPDYPWAVKVEGHDGEACGGAGMPCPRCCSGIPQDGTTSIAVAFVPDWKRRRDAELDPADL
jgi:hypothetical protein